MKEFLEFTVKNLVDYPEKVTIEEEEKSDSLAVIIHVAKEDLGKVIGKNGRVIKAIRTALRNLYGSSQKKIDISVS